MEPNSRLLLGVVCSLGMVFRCGVGEGGEMLNHHKLITFVPISKEHKEVRGILL